MKRCLRIIALLLVLSSLCTVAYAEWGDLSGINLDGLPNIPAGTTVPNLTYDVAINEGTIHLTQYTDKDYGSVFWNKGTIGQFAGKMIRNDGSVRSLLVNQFYSTVMEANFGTVDTNSATIFLNGEQGVIDTLNTIGYVDENRGRIKQGHGAVKTNNGTIDLMTGSFQDNYGTIGFNQSASSRQDVSYYEDMLFTKVTETFVPTNYGRIDTNTGWVYNNSWGASIGENYGTVYGIGVIETNYGHVHGGVMVTNQNYRVLISTAENVFDTTLPEGLSCEILSQTFTAKYVSGRFVHAGDTVRVRVNDNSYIVENGTLLGDGVWELTAGGKNIHDCQLVVRLHKLGEYASDNNVSCFKDGTKTAECTLCSFRHTLTDEGTSRGSHLWKTEYDWNQREHYFICADCGQHSQAEAHTFQDITCTVCGYITECKHGGARGVCPICHYPGGQIGDDVYFTLHENDTMVIFGSGDMWDDCGFDYFENFIPVLSKNYVRTIEIRDGVTSIGNHAFVHFTVLTSCVLPDGLTRIGENSFYDCSSLQSLRIPNTVESIGKQAFAVSARTKLNLYYGEIDHIPSFGESAFKGRNLLQDFYFSSPIPPSIDWDALKTGASTTTVHYPCGSEAWTALKLSEYGITEVVEHTGVEAGVCIGCGFACPHAGLALNCTTPVFCADCQCEVVDPDAHTPGETLGASAAGHYHACVLCGASSGDDAAHTYEGGVCTVCAYACAHRWLAGTCQDCGAVCTHTGGTASCMAYALCETCGSPYGDLEAHSFTVLNGSAQGHAMTCAVCTAPETEPEAHVWENGVCTACAYVCAHTYDPESGACTLCDVVCSHVFDEGTCTVCGHVCEHSALGGTPQDNFIFTPNVGTMTHTSQCRTCGIRYTEEPCVMEDGMCIGCGRLNYIPVTLRFFDGGTELQDLGTVYRYVAEDWYHQVSLPAPEVTGARVFVGWADDAGNEVGTWYSFNAVTEPITLGFHAIWQEAAVRVTVTSDGKPSTWYDTDVSAALMAACGENGTVELLKDVTLGEDPLNLWSGSAVLRLNGHTLTASVEGAMLVLNEAELRVIPDGGSIVNTRGTLLPDYYAMINDNGAAVDTFAGPVTLRLCPPEGSITGLCELCGEMQVIPADLPRLTLPASTTTIQAEAFANTPAQVVVLPLGCTHVDATAFSGSSVTYVVIPADYAGDLVWIDTDTMHVVRLSK